MWDIAGDSFEDEGMLEVQSDHYEVVADLIQTSFLFSIPMDGPMSFSTPHVSLQWALRFEFFTTPKNVDWTRLVLPINSPLLYLYDSSENNKNKNIVVFLSVLGFPRKSRGQSSFNAMDEWFRHLQTTSTNAIPSILPLFVLPNTSHAPPPKLHVPAHPAQTMLTIPSMQPSSSSVA
ncbi:uncharacterized protein E5676_scaffold461G00160 [Cucumis melo var. makuwa]|uniref:Uncharacterized protein n=1 Tax=Cucumis melo var. makuwa TaxID=1194695 RepID=A0A5D3CSD3_CUCMM|nr:uncharacterized protein E5676_scaffold461G00160 [Cucumis melo var. makuwa]